MTAAPVALDCDTDDAAADWVVVWRLMRSQDPGRTPTPAEKRLAMWLLLDLGCDQTQTRALTGMTKSQVYEVNHLRTIIRRPRDYTKQEVRAAYAKAPSEWERIMIGVARGATRD